MPPSLDLQRQQQQQQQQLKTTTPKMSDYVSIPVATLLSSSLRSVKNNRSGVIKSANTGNRKQQPRSSSPNHQER
jgi:hypothetical protein